jgi:hypothetical protein
MGWVGGEKAERGAFGRWRSASLEVGGKDEGRWMMDERRKII